MPITTLANGMRFASIRHSSLPVYAIGLSVRAGSAAESERTRGAAHFIEHLTLGPAAGASRSGLASAFDELGAKPTALTGKESTAYSVRVPSDDLPAALQAFRVVLAPPDMSSLRIHAERQTVLAERAALRQDLERSAIVDAESRLFKGTPLSPVPIGTADDIRALDGEAVAEYWSTNYLPANVDVLLVGPARHRELLARICEAFGTEPTSAREKPESIPSLTSRPPHSAAVVGPTESVPVSPVVWALPAPGARDESRVHAVVLASILTSGFGSLLVSDLRVERQLAYSPRAFYTGYGERGLLTISASTSTDRTAEVLSRIRSVLERIAADELPPHQLAYAIRHVECSTRIAHADQSGLLRSLASSVQYLGRRSRLDELTRMIRAVRPAQIAAMAEEMLSSDLEVVTRD